MKKVVFGVLAAASLSACVQLPIYEPMTEAEMSSYTCRDIWKESERLTRVINNVRADNLKSAPEGRDAQVMDAAQHRLDQVQELSVQKMCTYG
ncbi:MAG: hypothetical protein GX860_00265 [Alcaligenaceae bacterium]|jgi:hypothetical protein|nr:hypothetical protein [Alcaligenaceae bacterium]